MTFCDRPCRAKRTRTMRSPEDWRQGNAGLLLRSAATNTSTGLVFPESQPGAWSLNAASPKKTECFLVAVSAEVLEDTSELGPTVQHEHRGLRHSPHGTPGQKRTPPKTDFKPVFQLMFPCLRLFVPHVVYYGAMSERAHWPLWQTPCNITRRTGTKRVAFESRKSNPSLAQWTEIPIPTLGHKVCKQDLVWAVWSTREWYRGPCVTCALNPPLLSYNLHAPRAFRLRHATGSSREHG